MRRMNAETQKQVLTIAEELKDLFGEGFGVCYEVSIVLMAKLKRIGLEPKLVKGTFFTDYPQDYNDPDDEGGPAIHFWVECQGCLIDLTAEQFNECMDKEEMPKIVLCPLKEKNWRYKKQKSIKPEDSVSRAFCKIFPEWSYQRIFDTICEVFPGEVLPEPESDKLAPCLTTW